MRNLFQGRLEFGPKKLQCPVVFYQAGNQVANMSEFLAFLRAGMHGWK